MKEPKIHKSVMVDEAVDALHVKNPSEGGKQANYIDGTLGTGGHSLEILRRGGRVLGIDMDPDMLTIATERLSKEFDPGNFKLVNGNFTEMDSFVNKYEWKPVSGILLDLGVSNLHLKNEIKGFSFENGDAALDMRLDYSSQGVTAADLLNVLRRDQLVDMFSVTMEAGSARWLAGRVIKFREDKKIEKVSDALEIVSGLKTGKTGLSQATLPFLALRIAVNSELDNLKSVLPTAYELLDDGGRLVVISFHSGEDRIVKDFFAGYGGSDLVLPNLNEIKENPRARSAKMRVLQKNVN